MELSWIEKKTELEPVPEPEPEPHRCSKMHEDIRFDFGSPVDDDWWLSEQRDGHWHPIQDFDKCPLCGWVPPSGKEETADEWVPIGDVKPGSIVEVRGGGQCVWTNKRSLVSLHTGSINNRVHSTEFKVIAPPQ